MFLLSAVKAASFRTEAFGDFQLMTANNDIFGAIATERELRAL